MKKIILSLVTIFAFASSASAQIVIPSEDVNVIPSYFTLRNIPYLFFDYKNSETGERSCSIYDLNLNPIKTFVPTIDICSSENRLYCDVFIDSKGLHRDMNWGRTFHLTQTFFNDDEDWEYIMPIKKEVTDEYGWTNIETVSYTIIKDNGEVAANIPVEKWLDDIWIIDDVAYVHLHINQGNYTYTDLLYTLPEYRKFILDNTNSVKPVPAMTRTRTIDKDTYDISGRKVSSNHKGIIIKNGKKMMNVE